MSFDGETDDGRKNYSTVTMTIEINDDNTIMIHNLLIPISVGRQYPLPLPLPETILDKMVPRQTLGVLILGATTKGITREFRLRRKESFRLS